MTVPLTLQGLDWWMEQEIIVFREGICEVSSLDFEKFLNPPPAHRPKLRWMWPGVAVNDVELAAEIEEMARAGFGGAEIAFLTQGIPPTESPLEGHAWGSTFWADRCQAAMKAGADYGVGVDLTLGPGWPWASPAVSGDNIELSQQELVHGQQVLFGPRHFAGKPSHAVFDASHTTLVAVTAARLEGSMLHAMRNLAAEKKVLLDPGSTVDLTSKLTQEGQVEWAVPPGTWILFGFWCRPTHQQVRMAHSSPDSPLLVVDHMRRESAEAALNLLDRRLLDNVSGTRASLREVFEDSLELHANGLLWTPAFLTQFKRRRGYDLTPYLPVVSFTPWERASVRMVTKPFMDETYGASPGVGPQLAIFDLPGDDGERVRRDYHQTLTDLWIDNHLLPACEWAHRHQISFRSQVYGTTFDNIAAAKAVDIPETEDLYGSSIDFWKTIASGAHLSGARKVSMEHGVVPLGDYTMTLRELKRRADKAFASGVNQIITHGYPYKHVAGADWPGWAPFSTDYFGGDGSFGYSDAWNGTNPQWRHLRPLADYLARAQTVLRAGRPANDVAVYRDVYGYISRGGGLLDLAEPALNTGLSRVGFSFDFIDPGTLVDSATTVRESRLVVREPAYKALIVDLESSKRLGAVDNSRAMSALVARRLVSFAEAGLPIVFVECFPERGVSFKSPKAEDASVRAAVARLKRLGSVRLVADNTDVPATLAELGIEPDLTFDRPQDVYSIRRQTTGGDYWFLWNAADEPSRFKGYFKVPQGAPEVWDLWTGAVHPVGLYGTGAGRLEVPIELGPLETLVLAFEKTAPRFHITHTDAGEVLARGGQLIVRSTQSGTAHVKLSDDTEETVSFGELPTPIELTSWYLNVEATQPDGTESRDLTLSELRDWRELPDLKNTSGTAVYRTNITLPENWVTDQRGAYLQLGRVEGSVQVTVNSALVSPASVAPPRFDVGAFLHLGINAVEIELATTLKNRLSSMAAQKGYYRFLTRPDKTQPYGLIGPVRLIPYEERVIAPKQAHRP